MLLTSLSMFKMAHSVLVSVSEWCFIAKSSLGACNFCEWAMACGLP